MVRRGHRAVMLFLIQIGSAQRFALAADLDPTYAQAFVRARQAGVEALAYRCVVSGDGIAVGSRVPIVAPG
jgi:sugar fermentation stimulation protein A